MEITDHEARQYICDMLLRIRRQLTSATPPAAGTAREIAKIDAALQLAGSAVVDPMTFPLPARQELPPPPFRRPTHHEGREAFWTHYIYWQSKRQRRPTIAEIASTFGTEYSEKTIKRWRVEYEVELYGAEIEELFDGK